MSEGNGMMVWSFGGKWADFDTMKYTLDSKPSLDAHNFVYGWYNRKLIMPPQWSPSWKAGTRSRSPWARRLPPSALAAHSFHQAGDRRHFEYDIAPCLGGRRGSQA